ncbi:MAG TPA: DNA methyltransferase [Chthonomonadales bacterium]|nr:DNA methyltransferase [Chthonomonadales bacterium]
MQNASIPLDTVLEGDCAELMARLPDRCADLIFADPPYNLRLAGDLRRPDLSRVDAVDDAWDQFESPQRYDQFTRDWLTAARRILKPNGTLWVIGSYHSIYRVGAILMDLGYWILNDIVWIKANPTPQMRGVRFCNAHETLLWAARDSTASGITFNYRALKAGNEDRQVRSDWYFPVCSGGERLRTGAARAHSTQKPEALLHRIISGTSRPGDLVVDPFCGSGTTAAVARRLGRRFVTMDRDPAYVEIARARIAAVSPDLALADAIDVDAPPPRVPFATLVETGMLPAGTRLRLNRSGAEAIVQNDGTLAADGLRGSIHRLGARLLDAPACNGWEHWYYEDPATGRLLPINALRAALAGHPPASREPLLSLVASREDDP